jgi:hypothetical protein
MTATPWTLVILSSPGFAYNATVKNLPSEATCKVLGTALRPDVTWTCQPSPPLRKCDPAVS